MIAEGLVSSISKEGIVNLAPMGPIVIGQFEQLILRPFESSTTYQNLNRHPEGVFHITDDVETIALAAIGKLAPIHPPHPDWERASLVQGWVWRGAVRSYEFRFQPGATQVSPNVPGRREFLAEVLHVGHYRDFWGFNRAKHAVLEAAILATRLHLSPIEDVLREFDRLRIPVEKTAGEAERRAFESLRAYVLEWREKP